MSSPKHPDVSPGGGQIVDPTPVGRYLMFDEIGRGGMASVHLGLLSGAVGFQRTVAIKRLHPQFLDDPDFCAQFVDEARLAARINHPNVVQTLDVVWAGEELLLVLEYVDGDTLTRVLNTVAKQEQHVPIDVACAILSGALHGLHAAHEATDDQGTPLDIVHRDVSPQNLLIARDGVTRVLDFGVAKAAARSHSTQVGFIKGKFGYMAPEQIKRGKVDRRTDVFAAGIVLWETLTRRRLFHADGTIEDAFAQIMTQQVPRPGEYRRGIPKALEAISAKALQKDPAARFQSAEEFAVALELAVDTASPHVVKRWFEPLASAELDARTRQTKLINKRFASRLGSAPPYAASRTNKSKAQPTRAGKRPGSQVTRADARSALDFGHAPGPLPRSTREQAAVGLVEAVPQALRTIKVRANAHDSLLPGTTAIPPEPCSAQSQLTQFESTLSGVTLFRPAFPIWKVSAALGMLLFIALLMRPDFAVPWQGSVSQALGALKGLASPVSASKAGSMLSPSRVPVDTDATLATPEASTPDTAVTVDPVHVAQPIRPRAPLLRASDLPAVMTDGRESATTTPSTAASHRTRRAQTRM